jgi:hypothetical protein
MVGEPCRLDVTLGLIGCRSVAELGCACSGEACNREAALPDEPIDVGT